MTRCQQSGYEPFEIRGGRFGYVLRAARCGGGISSGKSRWIAMVRNPAQLMHPCVQDATLPVPRPLSHLHRESTPVQGETTTQVQDKSGM